MKYVSTVQKHLSKCLSISWSTHSTDVGQQPLCDSRSREQSTSIFMSKEKIIPAKCVLRRNSYLS